MLTKEFDPGGAQQTPKGCAEVLGSRIAERYKDGDAYMVLTTDGRRLHLDSTPTTAEGEEMVRQHQVGNKHTPSRQEAIAAWEAAHPGPNGPAFMPGLSMEEKMCVVADRLNKQAKEAHYDDGHVYDCHGSEDARASLRNTVLLEEKYATP